MANPPRPIDSDSSNASPQREDAEGGARSKSVDPEVTADQLAFKRTVNAFMSYAQSAMAAVTQREKDWRSLSDAHKELLGFDGQDMVWDRQRAAIAVNQRFFNTIADAAPALFSSYWPDNQVETLEEMFENSKQSDIVPRSMDIDKVYSTLRQFVRDWTEEGLEERESVYAPIRSSLAHFFPNPRERKDLHVLVPGAGLSRLSFEIALMGFCSQGNEFSYHMLLAGHWILNHAERSKQYCIHPFCDTSLNVFSRADQFRGCPVPDVSTLDAVAALQNDANWGDGLPAEFGEFSMIAGEFVEVYGKPEQKGKWNAVVTCFFIDTAHNIFEYLDVLWDLLTPGGRWINVGPLLYHWSDQLSEKSIDLAYDELRNVIQRKGFVFTQETLVQTRYATNCRSMKQQHFQCPFFAVTKPDPRKPHGKKGVKQPQQNGNNNSGSTAAPQKA